MDVVFVFESLSPQVYIDPMSVSIKLCKLIRMFEGALTIETESIIKLMESSENKSCIPDHSALLYHKQPLQRVAKFVLGWNILLKETVGMLDPICCHPNRTQCQ